MKKINKKYLALGIIVLIVVIGLFRNSGDKAVESTTVSKGDVVQEINVTGKVAPFEKADLSFEKTGIIASLKVKVGDKVSAGQVLGSLDSGEAYGSFKGAEANTLSEQAKLDEVLKGTRSEELNISKEDYINSERTVINSARDVFVKIDDAIRIKIDTMFVNGGSVVPDFIPIISSRPQELELEKKRLLLTNILRDWHDKYTNATDTTAIISFTRDSLYSSKSFLDSVSSIMSEIVSPLSSGLSEVTLNQYKATLNEALAEITTANTNFITAESAFETARDQYSLKKTGATAETIAAQMAKVQQAQANTMNLAATLRKMTIVSPLDGIVTLVKPSLGETVNGGQVVFSVMTGDRFKIEVFVPESDIAKVKISNIAKVNLDAYGKDILFNASVILIDPAETIVEGIPTYKVTLSIENDERIRSGMTADIHLVTAEQKDVLVIPLRSIVEKDGKVTVQKIEGKKNIEIPVTIGLKGSNGSVEIKNGLNIGDYVRTN